MKSYFQVLILALHLIPVVSDAQLTTLPDGGNKKAMVEETIGLTTVTINYHRPGVKGREGKIWGGLVYEGYADLGYGTSKASPWRAGANENTTIEFSTDVEIEGKRLLKGRYGFYIAWDKTEPTLIFSNNDSLWGSYSYNDKEDALRVKVKPIVIHESVEWLRYEFYDQSDSAATVALEWEKIRIPFRISVNYMKYQFESFRDELKSGNARSWEGFVQAATFTSDNNVNLAEGLAWAESAINDPSAGKKNFQTYFAKVNVLQKMGRTAEAEPTMKEALKYGNAVEINMYARKLLAEKRNAEAFETFKMNYLKHPDEFPALVGMMRAYSSKGNYKKASDFATKALAVAPDIASKTKVENMIAKLKEGKDVN